MELAPEAVESGRTIAGETRGATRQMALEGWCLGLTDCAASGPKKLNGGGFPLARLSLCREGAAVKRSDTEQGGAVELRAKACHEA